MKVGKVIRGVLIAYPALGVAVVLVQFLATNVMEPGCAGLARYTLAEGSRVRQIFTWLPDFYRETIRGEMTLRNYLLGGLQCEGEGLALVDVESLRGFIQGVDRPSESISSIMEKAATSSPNAVQSGSKAAALLNETAPRTIELDGVSFELPGNWRERDRAKEPANTEINARVSPTSIREYRSPDQPPTVLVALKVYSIGDVGIPSLEDFTKAQIPQIERIGLRNVVVTTASSISVGALPGSYVVFQGDRAPGEKWAYAVVSAYKPMGQVHLCLVYRIQPGNPYLDELDRARNSLKIGK